MRTRSPRFRDALTGPHTLLSVLEVLAPGRTNGFLIPIKGGSHSSDRSRPIRDALTVTLAPDERLAHTLHTSRTRLRVWQGVDYDRTWRPEYGLHAGNVEWLAVSTGRLRTATPVLVWDTRGGQQLAAQSWQVTALGIESYAVGDRFAAPYQHPGGSNVEQIRRLLAQSTPPPFVFTALGPDAPSHAVTWDTGDQRHGGEDAAIPMLARAGGCEVYADGAGQLIYRPTPGLDDLVTGVVQGGPRGTLIDVQRAYSREGAANVIVASTTRGDGSEPLVLVEWDRDPWSPTFLHRTDWRVDLSAQTEATFGREVLEVTSPLAQNVEQLSLFARSHLADRRGLEVRTGVDVVSDPAVECGDVQRVQTDVGMQVQIVESLNRPLEPGQMSMTYRTVRVDRT